MLVITNEDGSGINSFFPILLGKYKGNIFVADWKRYRLFARLYVLINVAFCIFFAAMLTRHDSERVEKIYALVNPGLFLYAFWRVKFGQKRVKLSLAKGVHRAVAPLIVWLDYLSFSVALILTQSVGLALESDFLLRQFLVLLQVVFGLYGALPIMNYLEFRREIRNS